LVTANYKLSFDSLRFSVSGIDAWLLVADTRGINVWCAADKGTFSAGEVSDLVRRSRLAEVVSHRRLVLPQLAAPGVTAREVTRDCGFSVRFGPVRATDLPAWLERDGQGDEAMREVTFTLAERAVLIPVELYLLARPLLGLVVLALCLSGLGPGVFSPAAAVQRGVLLLGATGLGILAGAVLVPLLLPWLPARQFWLKGVYTGLAVAALARPLVATGVSGVEQAALTLWAVAVSSYLAMNFTGSTPFTSLSGVEREMRRGLPVQLLAVGAAAVLWVVAPFLV
ncbi:MAG: hypothetical protein KAY58_00995, partial [Desulfobulbus sp.]|nr:hypothetical protein [Desulfobulbus sp.]